MVLKTLSLLHLLLVALLAATSSARPVGPREEGAFPGAAATGTFTSLVPAAQRPMFSWKYHVGALRGTVMELSTYRLDPGRTFPSTQALGRVRFTSRLVSSVRDLGHRTLAGFSSVRFRLRRTVVVDGQTRRFVLRGRVILLRGPGAGLVTLRSGTQSAAAAEPRPADHQVVLGALSTHSPRYLDPFRRLGAGMAFRGRLPRARPSTPTRAGPTRASPVSVSVPVPRPGTAGHVGDGAGAALQSELRKRSGDPIGIPIPKEGGAQPKLPPKGYKADPLEGV
ncbi:hypothetical protein P8C59_007492 [Phyllachora maydis]|uniref:Uncharacterized protein n=1 Tax=Phyllachora maydis TaxID=1825666 RepID=A0AAD9I9N6_9PEZI|nr:hypothetical protein P8C59_007492 [Phyllachora maydis]